MTRGDDPDAPTTRLSKFRQADARREAVEMDQVRTLVAEPFVQRSGTSNGYAVIRLVPGWWAGDRVAEYRRVIVDVYAGPAAVGGRRGNQNLVAGLAQATTQSLYVYFGAAHAVGKVPADQVDDFHRHA